MDFFGKKKAEGAEAAGANGEAEARKKRSMALLRERKVSVIEHLPVIETEGEAKIRGPQEVARRAVVLALVAAYAEPEGLPKEQLMALLGRFGVADELTPGERAFLLLADAGEEERAQFVWRYECVHVLLWALGHVQALDFPAGICHVPETVGLIAKSEPSKFIGEAKLRKAGEILDEADLIYRYNWACVSARISGKPAPAGLNSGVVVERHYALNWLIGYMGQEWDDVSTDT